MIAKTTLLIRALMTTAVSVSAEESPFMTFMRCIWVSGASRYNAIDQCVASRANQYLGRTIDVKIDTIENKYIMGHNSNWEKVNSTTFRYYNEIDNFRFIYYARFSDDFSYLSIKKVVWEGEPDRGMTMRNEFFITEYYVAKEVEPCKSQDEFENKILIFH